MQRRQFFFSLAASAAFALVSCGLASATPIQSFTTVFGPNPPGAGGGSLAPDVGLFPSPGVLGAIDNFTDFAVQNLATDLQGGSANTGQILFFQAGGPTGFYVGGAPATPAFGNPLTPQGEINLGGPVFNNRAYGVFGTGRSDIVFDPGVVISADLQARGTSSTDSIGPADVGQSLPPGSPLANANGQLLIYTDLGLQVTTDVVDINDFETFNVALGDVIDGQTISGAYISRIGLVNDGPVNSAVVLGELTVTTIGLTPNGLPVPEPTAVVLASLAAGLVATRRRR